MSSAPSSHALPRHRISKGACDFCRRKKIKCQPAAGKTSLTWIQSRYQEVCCACQAASVPCTFELPVKKRGPAKGRKRTLKEDENAAFPSSPESFNSAIPGLFQGVSNSHPPSSPAARSNTDFNGENETATPYSPGVLPISSAGIQVSVFSIESICSRTVFLGLIDAFLDLVYPLYPIVHRPTFLQDIRGNRLSYDNVFLSLSLSICAVVVALMPRKFQEYKHGAEPLSFQTRTQMIEACCKLALELRPVDYFDTFEISKWAISFMFQAAYYQVGHQHRTCFWNAEASQMARLLRFDDPNSFVGLGCIEVQLRKKAFWMMFFPFVHQHLGNSDAPLLILYDKDLFNSIPVEDLWPIEVDDEYISNDGVRPQPQNLVSLTTGFNIGAHLFWISCTHLSRGQIRRQLTPSAQASVGRNDVVESLRGRIADLNYLIQGIHPKFSLWIPGIGEDSNNPSEAAAHAQFQSIRANIHVTRLWLQSTLFESLVAIEQAGSTGQSTTPDTQLWNQREELCQQLLSVLHNMKQSSLEPNGNSLTSKIREVAATLLSCPFEQQGTIARRATSYLSSFVDILIRLDVREQNGPFFLDTQAWLDLSNLSEEADQVWSAHQNPVSSPFDRNSIAEG